MIAKMIPCFGIVGPTVIKYTTKYCREMGAVLVSTTIN
jgi:hypothetical protein